MNRVRERGFLTWGPVCQQRRGTTGDSLLRPASHHLLWPVVSVSMSMNSWAGLELLRSQLFNLDLNLMLN